MTATTWMIQAIQGRNGRFMDFYVEAKTEAAAIRKATALAKAQGFDLRWTRFVA
jgi:hypothetical protein